MKENKYGLEEKYSKYLTRNGIDFMRKCLDYDQNKRYTAHQLLNHEWFNEDENGNIDRVDIIKQNAIKLDYIKFMNKKS